MNCLEINIICSNVPAGSSCMVECTIAASSSSNGTTQRNLYGNLRFVTDIPEKVDPLGCG